MGKIHRKQPVPVLVQHALLRMGERVKVARKARGMTQAQLAQVSCVGVSTVASIEGGFDGVTIGNVLKVLDTMGLLEQAEGMFSHSTDPEVIDYARSQLLGSK